MKIPGFTAEASAYKSKRLQAKWGAAFPERQDQRVISQADEPPNDFVCAIMCLCCGGVVL